MTWKQRVNELIKAGRAETRTEAGRILFAERHGQYYHQAPPKSRPSKRLFGW